MSSVKTGDRGLLVQWAQAILNTFPSTLPALNVDGIFGPKTLQRTKEFQGDRRLQVDGIIGPKTWDQLLEPLVADVRSITAILFVAREGEPKLDGPARAYFNRTINRFVGQIQFAQQVNSTKPRSIVGSSTAAIAIPIPFPPLPPIPPPTGPAVPPAFLFSPYGLLAIAILILLALIISFLLSSRNPQTRSIGERLKKEQDDILKDASKDGPEETARRAARATKKAAKEFIDSKKKPLEDCKNNNLNPSGACAKALAEIDRILGEIAQKLKLDETRFSQLIQGITRNIQELMQAMRNAAIHCKGCDGLL